jgi:N-methylhydantoinase A
VTEAHKRPIKSAFDDLHRRTYGASAPEEDAELVTLRLVAEVPMPHLRLPRIAPGHLAHARIGRRPLYDLALAEFADADVYDRARLGAKDRIAGPAIVEQYDSTTVVLAGQTLSVDEFGNLVIAEEAR